VDEYNLRVRLDHGRTSLNKILKEY
jgi:hypothetical protein